MVTSRQRLRHRARKRNETTDACDRCHHTGRHECSLTVRSRRTCPADLDHGWSGQTTLILAELQGKAVLKRGRVAVGAVAILDVRNGDVLALRQFDPTNPATQFVNKEGPANVTSQNRAFRKHLVSHAATLVRDSARTNFSIHVCLRA